MMSIGVFDKGKCDSDFIQNVTKYAESNPEVCEQLSELHAHKIAIAHVSDKAWDSLLKQYSSRNQVRVRASTVDSLDLPKPVKNHHGVYIFYLMPSTDDLKTEWKEILSGLSDSKVVKELVNAGNPNELKSFFVHEVQEHLSALILLCEGYLAVHAEDTDISSALDLMGWTEFQKSERGQNLIQQDLSNKKSIVRRPQWWADVFEPESFDNGVKKEWEDTIGTEEIPTALNDLLEAIHAGDTVVPPKIVADAYCVLRKKNITEKSDWQSRRNKFNHDWLKNEFLNRFGGFIGRFQKRNPDDTDRDRMWEFLVKDFPSWKTHHRQEAQWIVESFEDSMSPRRLLNCAPLNGCDVETREWLGHLVHGLWLSHYSPKEKIKESQEALASVNKLYDELYEKYEKIVCELEQSNPINLTQFITLHTQFCELKETYRNFSKTLSNLPRRYESYGG